MATRKGMRCDCGGLARPSHTKVDGYKIRSWKCPRCDEEYLDSGDAEFVLLAKKMKRKPITAKVGILGDSFIVRIPRDLAEFLGLKKGDNARITLTGPRQIQISV
jgi:hypothetical protein